ncbi:MAG: hypothetical protein J0M30_02785 [Chitinophagales bacterium]|nr:hypothetical protein [Chitinophagales bacterium]
MKKLALLILGVLCGLQVIWAQLTIAGPGCVSPGRYTYYLTGSWNSKTTTMQWCVVGGTIVGGNTCKSGLNLSSVEVIWSTSGTLSVVTNNAGNASKAVGVTATLNGGSITANLTQTVSNNVPATITCSPAYGGYCSPTYQYQWQKSIDDINWTVLSGSTGLDLSFTSAPTQTTYYRRKVTETISGGIAYSNRATVFKALPLSPGSITSAPQTVSTTVIPSDLTASPASGGNCSGNYAYQWQYSFNGTVFEDIDSLLTQNLQFLEMLDSNTHFRRRVICGTDTAYTAAQMITVTRPFYPGLVTSPIQTINVNTIPAAIQASLPSNGSCGSSYTYQWQQSSDGYTFSTISGATSQNITFSSPLSATTYYRRKAFCGSESGYSNTVAVVVSPSQTTPALVLTPIDSLLNQAGINIPALFNLYNDTLANSRNNVDTMLVKAFDQDLLAQKLFAMNSASSTLEQAEIDSLFAEPLADSIGYRMNNSRYGGSGIDTMPALPPFLDDNIIQLYRSTGNYTGLDSIVNLEVLVSIEDVLATLGDSASTSYSQATSRIFPINFNLLSNWKRSAVINGPTLVIKNQTVQYTGTFNFPLGSPSDIRWLVTGGTIVSQNVNPASGTIYVNVNWTSSFGTPSVALIDFSSLQYQVLPVRFVTALISCFSFPYSQTIYYGQTPSVLNASTCNENLGNTFSYQWQVLDVYANTNWTDIVGATQATYQPPILSGAWFMYRRITKVFNSSGGLIGSYPTSAASIRLRDLDPGSISSTVTEVQYNTVPVVTQTAASAGYTASGSSLVYTWEYSTNGGTSWSTLGTGAAYPNVPLTSNIRVRRKIKIEGLPTGIYNLPQSFWQSYSNELRFTYVYQTADYENRNYIRENVVLTRGVTSWENADALPIEKKAQTTTYLDGLSRPIQVVGKGTHYDEVANQWYDMVQSITYEAGGRVDKSLLPYPSTENLGKFKINVTADQQAYYSSAYGEANAFSKVDYDGSPFNRVLKTYAPGASWQGSNVGVSGDVEAYSSSENVKWFTIGYNSTDRPILKGTYSSYELVKTFGKDEKDKKVVTYMDRMGQVVLKKVQLADEGPGLTTQHQGWLCTYYVYNDLGQLRYTITPKAIPLMEQNGWQVTQAIADELCFWYDYDELGRAIAKKTPGKGVEYIVYDKRNRPVFTQDANQRAKSPDEWLAVFYDVLNRPRLTGIYKSNSTRDQLQAVASVAATSEGIALSGGGSVMLWGCPLTNSDINNTSLFQQLSASFYDSYGFSGVKTFNSTHTQNLSYRNAGGTGDVEPAVKSERVKGLLTGSRTLVLDGAGTPQYLNSSIFFDEEGRTIQAQSDNVKSGVEIVSNQYHFDGRLLSSSETHNGTGTVYTNFNILTKYKFDKVGRAVGIGKKLNITSRSYVASPNVLTAEEDNDAGYKITVAYKFNKMGQLATKTLSPTGGPGGTALETLDYSYNIRGWLTGINKNYALGEYTSNQWDHFFGMYIGYDNADGKFSTPQKNGQITGLLWKSQGDNTPRKFDFVYDNANRLVAANFKQRGSSTESWNSTKVDFSTRDVTYDENGNILTLKHMGILPGTSAPVTIDNLVYNYVTQTNRLSRVDDNGGIGANNGKQSDFKDGENAVGTEDYNFDANGNLILDNNRRVSSVTYNYLDKPELITIAPPQGSAGGGTIRYIYAAGGGKLQKIVTENPSIANGNQQRITTTTYIGAYVYEKLTIAGVPQPEVLQMVGHEEGRIRVITPYSNPSDPANYIGGGVALPGGKQGVFDYFITDNLANVRAVITEEINTASSICTMENSNSTVQQYEEALFGNPTNNEVSSTRIGKPTAWTANTSGQVSKLQSPDGSATKVGPNVLLKVMAGDLLNARVDYYYQNNPGSNPLPSNGLNALVNTLLGALNGGKATGLTKDRAGEIGTALGATIPLQSLMSNQPGSGVQTAPRAYLNYIFFDEQFNYVDQISGFQRVSQSGNGAAPLQVTGLKAPKNGYVLVFLSNGSSESVYFDNFTVSQERGRLIEENHFYSYGLKIQAISSKALSSSLNAKMINHGYQGAFSEEVTEFELNYNEFSLRTYDPQIGQWTTPDPYDECPSQYTGMGNDPVNNIDPSGGSIWGSIFKFFGGTVSSGCPSALTSGATQAATASFATTVIRISTVSLAVGFGSAGHEINRAISSVLNEGGIGLNGSSETSAVSIDIQAGAKIANALNSSIISNAGSAEVVSNQGDVWSYPLYKTMDAAAFGWCLSNLSKWNNPTVEYSAVIYEITRDGNKYYGFTRAVKWDNKNENLAPGMDGKSMALYKSTLTLPDEAKIVAHIHFHLRGSHLIHPGFSWRSHASDNSDQSLKENNPGYSWYLLSHTDLLRKISKEESFHDGWVIAENFRQNVTYDIDGKDYTRPLPNLQKYRLDFAKYNNQNRYMDAYYWFDLQPITNYRTYINMKKQAWVGE